MRWNSLVSGLLENLTSLVLVPDLLPKKDLVRKSIFHTQGNKILTYPLQMLQTLHNFYLPRQGVISPLPSHPNSASLLTPQPTDLVCVLMLGMGRKKIVYFWLLVGLLNPTYFARSTYGEVGSILPVGRAIQLIPFFGLSLIFKKPLEMTWGKNP